MKRKQLLEEANKTPGELKKDLFEKTKILVKTKLAVKVGKEKNQRLIKNLRRDIAQILTIMRRNS